MDVGTNKEDLQSIPGHLFDIATPDRQLSLSEYQRLAYEAITDIVSRGKNPILVGGTGLYLNAVINGYLIPEVEPDLKLREKLNKLSVKELQDTLIKINKQKFESLNDSDKNNPRRLIRAIEKAQVPEIEQQENKLKDFEIILIKPEYDKDELFEKINRRVEEMFDLGLVDEVKELLSMGYSKDLEVMKGMGYKEVIDYLDGEISLEEAKKLIKTAHKQYVKRQETWFKKYM
jgi:tRNA dimethylallyltransferase